MKRLLGAFLVGTLVFGTVLGSAAALNVDGRVLQVGSDTTMACDADGVSIQWSAFTGIATGVYIHGVDATACAGQRLYVFPLDSAGKVVGMSRAVALGADECTIGTAIAPSPVDIVAGTDTYKVSLGWVDPATSFPAAASYPCGIDGSLIAGVRVMIGL